MSMTTISSKGQITLPAALLRERHLTPGTRLEIIATSRAIVLIAIPESLVHRLAGATQGIYGNSDDYVEGLRDEWT